MNTTFITQVQTALAQDLSFSAIKNGHGEWSIEPLPFWHRLLHCHDHAYHQRRIDYIAKGLFETLGKVPQLPLKDAMKHPALSASRKFLRGIDFSKEQPLMVNACSRQLLAAKLGLSLKIFLKNPGFEQFAFKSHLERYLMDYNHEIRVNPDTLEISLLCEGVYTTWPKIEVNLARWQQASNDVPEYPRLTWSYGTQGVQRKDLYAWSRLEPYKVLETHDWGNRYLFEFCACCGDSVQLNGDHSWLELKTPQGEIYSVGLYRPGKMSSLETYQFPMRVKKGYLMAPDVSIWWPTSIYRIPVEISKDQFEEIKSSIEHDKKNEDACCFQLFNGNCQEYVNSKAALAGIRLPTGHNVLRHITPISLQNGADWLLSHLPALAQRICHCAAAFLINTVQWALGAMMIDKSLRGKNIRIKTHLSTFRDFFDPDKLLYHPPRHLALVVKKEIDEWRKREGKPYALPDTDYLNKD